MLLQDVLKEFIYDCEVRSLSPRTVKGYRNNNARFFKFLEDEFDITEVEKLTRKHIQLYLQLLKDQKLSELYANSILKNIRSFLNYCLEEEYVKENVATKVKWVKEPTVLIETFTDEDINKMLKVFNFTDYLNARNNTILATFLDTGIRNLELCSIKNEDVRERDIRIMGKGNKERYVPITPFLKKYMIKYERIKEGYFKDKLRVEDYYFLSRTGRQLTVEANLHIFNQIEEKAGIENVRCSPHTARHYYAQTQLKNGLDTYSVSRILGHENISITKRYLQSLKDKDIIELATVTSPLMNLK